MSTIIHDSLQNHNVWKKDLNKPIRQKNALKMRSLEDLIQISPMKQKTLLKFRPHLSVQSNQTRIAMKSGMWIKPKSR